MTRRSTARIAAGRIMAGRIMAGRIMAGCIAAGCIMGTAFVAPVAAMPAVSAAPCAAAAGSVAIVVDYGDDSTPATAVCLPASSSDNGASVLAARAEALGKPAPRFSASGLLCAIDGVPAEGCGEQTGDTYAYWSYWRGSVAGWQYSNVGPAAGHVDPTRTEGWRFQQRGAGNPSDPPPRVSSNPAATCPPQSQDTSTTTTTLQASPTTSAAASSTSTSSVGTDASAPTSTTGPSSTSSSLTTTTTGDVAAGPVRITESDDDDPQLGPLVAGGVLIALGLLGALIAWRRGAGP